MKQPGSSSRTDPADRPAAGPGTDTAPRARWYSHGWNRPLAWRLIFGITPRLPRLVLIPLRHAFSLVFFVLMGRERSAVRRNLARVTGRKGLANLRMAYRLFYNYSRYLVAYTELRDVEPESFRHRLNDPDGTDAVLRDVIRQGRGGIIVTMHIGHWDLGLKLLSHYGVPIHVVMLSNEPAEVSRYADEARRLPCLKVHQVGDSALLAVELMAALDRGELVAVQIDRPAGQHVVRTPLFGEPAPLPAGPVQLAMATGAPVLPVFVVMDHGDSYRLVSQDPMRFERVRGDGSALDAAMRRVAAMMETVASRYPDQWFNFYDMWPVEAEAGAGRRRWTARLYDLLVKQHTGTLQLAIAVGLGVFIGVSPFYGLHTVLAIGLAWLLRLNIPVTILATQISNPIVAPFLITGSVWIGGELEHPGLANAAAAGPWWNPAHAEFYAAWLRGSLVLGAVLAVIIGSCVYFALEWKRGAHHA